MKKIRLDIDCLAVDTFVADAGPGPARRTVLANDASQMADTYPAESGWYECPTWDQFDRLCWAGEQEGCSNFCISVNVCLTNTCDSDELC